MKPLLAALALLFTPFLTAQPLEFGSPFPLTNTRYAKQDAVPTLASNGTDLLVFWPTSTNVRVTKVVEGEVRGGKNALAVGAPAFDVTWTGSHFLLAATKGRGIAGRLISRSGEPLGEELPLAEEGSLPRLASSGGSTLLVYHDNIRVHGLLLNADGTPADAPEVIFGLPANTTVNWFDVASNGNGYAVAISTTTEMRVLMLNEEGETVAETLVYSAANVDGYLGSVTVASNGSTYLAAWQTWDRRGMAARIAANGAAGPLLTFAEPQSIDSTLQSEWGGETWIVAHHANATVDLTHIDEPVRRVVGVEQTPGFWGSVAYARGRTFAAWQSVTQGAAVVSPLPLLQNDPEEKTFAAVRQTVGATAASTNATLVVWTEGRFGLTTLHAGLRTRDGSWTEREIAGVTGADVLDAASDGHEFVVLVATP